MTDLETRLREQLAAIAAGVTVDASVPPSARRNAQRFASLVIALLVLALAGGIAWTRLDSTNRHIRPTESTTTTSRSVPVPFEREAELAGVHYTLVLHTPVARPSTTVSVELLIENRTKHVVHLAPCASAFSITVFTPTRAEPPVKRRACSSSGSTALAAGGGLQDAAQTNAPQRPGRYLVGVATAHDLPRSLLEPLKLRVTTTAETRGAVNCSGEVSISPHPQLPETAGIVSLPGLTKAGADGSGGVPSSKGIRRDAPTLNCTYIAVGGISQFWVLSAAIAHYGSTEKVPLPLPLDFASRYPGPEEVNVNVVVFRDSASAQALLNNPVYNTNPGWTRPPDVSIPEGFIVKVDSLANGGLTEFIVQRAIRNTWIQVSVIGANLTLAQAVQVADSVGTT